MAILICSLVLGLSAQNSDVTIENGKYYAADGLLFTGVYEEYDEGRLVSQLNVREGELEGSASYFHLNGQLKESGMYNNGHKTGEWQQFNDVGLLVGVASFDSDLKHGKWIIWDDEGNIRFEMFYNKGQKTGVWRMWDEDGNETSKDFND